METDLEGCIHTFEKSCISGTVSLTLDGKLIFIRQFNQYIKVNINYKACADTTSNGTQSKGSGNEKSRHSIHGKRYGSEESSCSTQGKMSGYEESSHSTLGEKSVCETSSHSTLREKSVCKTSSHSTQNKGSGNEGSVESFVELATREYRDINLVCRAQGNKLSTNPTGANQTDSLPTGAKQTDSLPTGANQTKSLPTGANQTDSLPTGAKQTNSLPTGANQTNSLPTGAKQTYSLPAGAKQTYSLPTGAKQTNILPTEANQTDSLPTGANHSRNNLKETNQSSSYPKGANQINSYPKGANQINSYPKGANQINSYQIGTDRSSNSSQGANQINDDPIGAKLSSYNPNGENQSTSYPKEVIQSSSYFTESNHSSSYLREANDSSYSKEETQLIIALHELVQSSSYMKEEIDLRDLKEEIQVNNVQSEIDQSSRYIKEETQLSDCQNESDHLSSCLKEEIKLSNFLTESCKLSNYLKEETELRNGLKEENQVSICNKEKKLSRASASRQLCCKAKYQSEVSSHEPEVKKCKKSGEKDNVASCEKNGVSENMASCKKNGVSENMASCKISGVSDNVASCKKSGVSDTVASCKKSGVSDNVASCKKSGVSDNVASCKKSGVSDNVASCKKSGVSDNVASCKKSGVSDNGSRFVDQNAATGVMKTGLAGKDGGDSHYKTQFKSPGTKEVSLKHSLYGQNIASASKTLGTGDVSLTHRTDAVADDSCIVVGCSAPPKIISSQLGLRSHLSHKPAVPMTVITKNSVDNTFQPYTNKMSKNANQTVKTMIAQKKALNFSLTSSADSGKNQNNFQMTSSFSCNQAGGITVMHINHSGNTLQAPKFQESKYIIKTIPVQERPLNTFPLNNSTKSDKYLHSNSIVSQAAPVNTMCKEARHIIKTIPVQDRSLTNLSLNSEQSDQTEGKDMDNRSKLQESGVLCQGLQNNEHSQKPKTIQKKLSPFPDATAKLDSSSVVDSGFEIIEVEDSSEEDGDGSKDEICCPYCLDVFRSQQEYLDHKEIKRLSFDCKVCGETFPFKAHHIVHMRCHDATTPGLEGNERETSFKCELCSETFLNIPLLKGHMMLHTGEYAYKCCLCQKKSRSMAMHNKHMKAHDKSVKQKCSYCDRFFTAAEYKIHVHAHPKCHFCDQVFHNRMSRNFHYQKYHQDKCMNCEHCGNIFSSGEYLAAHLNYHRKKDREHCELCGFLVFNLDVHMKECHYGKGNKSLLCRHVLEHSNKMLSCRKCKTSFSIAGGLLTQLTKKHKKNWWTPQHFIRTLKSL